jgi:hypothetical protein
MSFLKCGDGRGGAMNESDQKAIPAQWLAEFDAAAKRPLRERFKYAFIKTYRPVLDDTKFRAFSTTADYRKWCDENLPDWLGFHSVPSSSNTGP